MRIITTRTNRAMPSAPPPRLLDHLVRSKQNRLRYCQAQRFGGLEVDDQLELRGLFDREFTRFGALEDLVHIDGRAPEHDGEVCRIGHEATGLHMLPEPVHCWQACLAARPAIGCA